MSQPLYSRNIHRKSQKENNNNDFIFIFLVFSVLQLDTIWKSREDVKTIKRSIKSVSLYIKLCLPKRGSGGINLQLEGQDEERREKNVELTIP